MTNTGELLKKSREDQGLSIHEVSLALKINSKILQAIEDGDSKHLPAKTFLRGFVKSYAAYLRLDQKAVMDSFAHEYGSTLPKATIHETPAPSGSTGAQPKSETPKPLKMEDHLTPKLRSVAQENPNDVEGKSSLRWYLTGGIALLIIAISTARNVTERYAKEADTSQIEADMATAAKVGAISSQNLQATTETNRGPEPKSIIDVKHERHELAGIPSQPNIAPAAPMTGSGQSVNQFGSAKPAAAVPAASPLASASPLPLLANTSASTKTAATPAMSVSAPTVQKSPTPAPQVVKTSPPTDVKTSVAKPTATPASATSTTTAQTAAAPTPAKSPGAGAAVSAAPTSAVKPAKGKPIELIVEALEGVEISYSTQGGVVQKVKLNGDQTHTFRSQSGLKLNISNGAAVNLILNGRDMGRAGEAGKPITLNY